VTSVTENGLFRSAASTFAPAPPHLPRRRPVLHQDILLDRGTHELLGLLSDGAQARLRATAYPFTLAPSIYRQEGDVCREVALLARGRLRVLKRRASGREITLYTVKPGELCTLEVLAVMAGTPYRAEAVAEEAAEGIAIPATLFRDLVDGEPALRSHLFRSSEARLAQALELVSDVALGTLEQRVAGLLLRLAEPDPAAALLVTHERIAHELACAREAVSRILGAWERAGVVRLGRAHLWVVDPDRLARIAAGS
jgi:CRP/FNR family transcriptional regulator